MTSVLFHAFFALKELLACNEGGALSAQQLRSPKLFAKMRVPTCAFALNAFSNIQYFHFFPFSWNICVCLLVYIWMWLDLQKNEPNVTLLKNKKERSLFYNNGPIGACVEKTPSYLSNIHFFLCCFVFIYFPLFFCAPQVDREPARRGVPTPNIRSENWKENSFSACT